MRPRAIRASATLAVLVLAACSGGGSGSVSKVNPVLPPSQVGSTASGSLRIVGVGDSLTAGYQSDGIAGQQVPTPASVPVFGEVFPAGPTQNNGFWSLIWEQANNFTPAQMLDPSTSPLPLIAAPGLGNLFALTSSGFPLGLNPTPSGQQCNATAQAAYQYSSALSLRLNPDRTPFDLGVPGQTLHEAVAMNGPISTCGAVPAQLAGLNQLVGSESENFYPILGTFGNGTTQLEDAVALRPQYATVLLGENDLLHSVFSNNGSPVTSPASFANDINTIVTKLQGTGTKVLLATLPDPLQAATFIPEPYYQATLTAFLTQGLEGEGVPPATAQGEAAAAAAQYAGAEIAQSGIGSGGYFTITALFDTVEAAASGSAPPTLSPDGDYVTDALAAQTESLLTAYNAAITADASADGATLVDLHALAPAVGYGQPFLVAPGDYVTATYLGGFYSLDGLHPSNTGYAVIANAFIAAMDAHLGLSVPAVNVDAIYQADPLRVTASTVRGKLMPAGLAKALARY